MEDIKKVSKEYLGLLKERSKNSRVYKPYQSIGLIIADLLQDADYKSFYIKLAKTHDNSELMRLAKDISEHKEIKNKGAYFMKVFAELQKEVKFRKNSV